MLKLTELSEEDRQNVFSTEAFATEDRLYMRPLEQSELEKSKDELSDIAIKMNELDEELERFKEDWKLRMKPLKQRFVATRTDLKNKAVQATGTLYLIKNWDDQMIEYYDESGIMVQSRRMTPEERQTGIRISQDNRFNSDHNSRRAM